LSSSCPAGTTTWIPPRRIRSPKRRGRRRLREVTGKKIKASQFYIISCGGLAAPKKSFERPIFFRRRSVIFYTDESPPLAFSSSPSQAPEARCMRCPHNRMATFSNCIFIFHLRLSSNAFPGHRHWVSVTDTFPRLQYGFFPLNIPYIMQAIMSIKYSGDFYKLLISFPLAQLAYF
jgi:hypothetical protein